MSELFVAEALLENQDVWISIGIWTDLGYLGDLCKTGGLQNHIGRIKYVRYRIYNSIKNKKVVENYQELIEPSKIIDKFLGHYIILNQRDLRALSHSFKSE